MAEASSEPVPVATAGAMFRSPTARAIETKEPVWLPEVTPDDGFLASSLICVPLIARGEAIGALTLAHAESDRRYGPADLAMATDLARRAAVAVENARLYERLRDEDQRKDEFLATLAHELRNPLAPVRTGLDVLRVGAKTDTSTEAVREIIERQIGHMTRLIDDLLDVSRVSRGKIELRREPLDVQQLVQSALEVSAPAIQAAGHRLVVNPVGPTLIVDGDRTRLAQVLSNLLNNAAKFTPAGGTLTLDVRREGSDVEIRLTDTGIGIRRELLGRVFEMFVQGGDQNGTQGGLGIGLTLVRRLVELHGGRVWVESEGPGRGSTFVVRLPLATAASDAAVATPDATEPAVTPRRILVVDDNVDAARMLATYLEMDKHVVRRAASGKEALEVLKDFKPEIALLDIGLPGISGLELARLMPADESLRGVLLVAVTGWGQEEDRRRSREAGFDHHLTKPTDAEDLAAVIDAAGRPTKSG